MNKNKTIAVIGAGAAGFFGAIACAEANPQCHVIILEKNRQILSKVRISGGGRCNVTHACFEPSQLIQNYPRGGKELRGPFSRFQPKDTVQWFESRDVQLKIEADGRMFPVTNSSETIIHCLTNAAHKAGVEVWTECGVIDCIRRDEKFILSLSNEKTLECEAVLVAAGGNSKVNLWLEKMGHTFSSPVPSLFTFNIPHSPLNALAGISVPKVKIDIEEAHLQQTGPLLITHWGFSGPAVLKLSAWGARFLHERQYKAAIKVDWLPDLDIHALKQLLEVHKKLWAARLLQGDAPVPLPKNLWKALLHMADIPQAQRWAMLSKVQTTNLINLLHACVFHIEGKSTYKEEFVTCGGISLKEVDFKTMQSRLCPGLYFAGEVLDVDGITGGFNFQNAWTTSWIAGNALGK